MNRYASKVSDYGLIFRAWSRGEPGLLCSNDGMRRLGKKYETEGQVMERKRRQRWCKKGKMYGSDRGVRVSH